MKEIISRLETQNSKLDGKLEKVGLCPLCLQLYSYRTKYLGLDRARPAGVLRSMP